MVEADSFAALIGLEIAKLERAIDEQDVILANAESARIAVEARATLRALEERMKGLRRMQVAYSADGEDPTDEGCADRAWRRRSPAVSARPKLQ